MYTWEQNNGQTMLFAHLDTTRFLYQSPGLNEDQNWLKIDEVAALKQLQFRSGNGQFRVQYMHGREL